MTLSGSGDPADVVTDEVILGRWALTQHDRPPYEKRKCGHRHTRESGGGGLVSPEAPEHQGSSISLEGEREAGTDSPSQLQKAHALPTPCSWTSGLQNWVFSPPTEDRGQPMSISAFPVVAFRFLPPHKGTQQEGRHREEGGGARGERLLFPSTNIRPGLRGWGPWGHLVGEGSSTG